ncbi:prepilin peptidase [Candidatus Bathyarchaeota archaeon]|nr:prepilin peptidase [Candidatus Bathyarchaeota archaeon]
MQIILSTLRISVALIFLLYASFSDYKTREVSNKVWVFFALSALALTVVELPYYWSMPDILSYGLCFGLTAAFAVILFYSGGFGGADAKALMCLALVLPFYPEILLTPLSGTISLISEKFFPISVFSNSVLLAAATAIYIFLRNITWRIRTSRELFEQSQKNESFGKKALVLITGYKISVNKLKEKWHVYPLEDIEETGNELKRKLLLVPKDESREAIVERLAKAVEAKKIQDMVWATPGLPMLIFITAGLIIALFLGDIVWIFVRFLLA